MEPVVVRGVDASLQRLLLDGRLADVAHAVEHCAVVQGRHGQLVLLLERVAGGTHCYIVHGTCGNTIIDQFIQDLIPHSIIRFIYSRPWATIAVVCHPHYVLDLAGPRGTNAEACQNSTASCNFLFFLIIVPGVESLLYVKVSAVMAYSLFVYFMAPETYFPSSLLCRSNVQ